MKKSFTKQEIRGVIQEIIGDIWHNFITGKPLGARNHKNDDPEEHLYKDVDQWVEDMVDLDDGTYIGPELIGRPTHNFKKGAYIRNPTDEITHTDIEKMLKWNEAYAFDAGMKVQVVSAFNTRILDHYRMNRQSKLFGSFPT